VRRGITVTIPPEKVERDFRDRRLMPALAGILNWALAGLTAYLKEGLNPPLAVLNATEEYRQDMDVVEQWIEDCGEIDLRAVVPSSIAYDSYARWAENEIGWKLTRLRFARVLTGRGFDREKGTAGQRLIRGLRLKIGPAIGLAATPHG
jgi:putative DNA primase/helicase